MVFRHVKGKGRGKGARVDTSLKAVKQNCGNNKCDTLTAFTNTV